MNHSALHELIRKVSPKAGGFELDDSTLLLDSSILDSISLVDLISAMEEKFKIVFDYSDLKAANFENIPALADMLKSKYGLEGI